MNTTLMASQEKAEELSKVDFHLLWSRIKRRIARDRIIMEAGSPLTKAQRNRDAHIVIREGVRAAHLAVVLDAIDKRKAQGGEA